MSDSLDSPGELTFVSEHGSDSDSSDKPAHTEREKKVKKKKVKKKKSEGGVTSTPACVTLANPAFPSDSSGMKTPKIIERPLQTAGQTNGAFEPDFED